jgi:hypothetical protein
VAGVAQIELPNRVWARPWRPARVGMTQSNMSMPRRTASTMSSACPRPSGSAGLLGAADSGSTASIIASMTSCGSPHRKAADGVAVEIRWRRAPRALSTAQRRHGPSLHDAEQSRCRAARRRPRFERSAQRSD